MARPRPVAYLIPPGQFLYQAIATAFNETLAQAGLSVDRSSESMTQLCFLPNPLTAAFEFHVEQGPPVTPP